MTVPVTSIFIVLICKKKSSLFHTGLASADSVFDGASDQKPVTILVVLVGSVVLVVAAFGAISWRRRYGKFPYPWTSSYENNNHQSVRQSLRDPETVSVNQQVIYGAVE